MNTSHASHASESRSEPVAFATIRDRIAVGVDFSSCSEHALEVAGDLALRAGVELIPIHVCETAPLSFYSQIRPRFETILRERMDDARDALEIRCEPLEARGVQVTPRVVAGKPDSLGAIASQHGAALLVVGTHGRTGFRRLLLGSVAERAVRTSPTDVLVARGTPTRFRRILVPTDFSPLARRALELAVQLVEPGGTIQLLHCCPMSPLVSTTLATPAVTTANYFESASQAANTTGERLLAEFDDVPATLEFACVASPPTAEIRRRLADGAADGGPEGGPEGGFDLVVMGGSGREGLERFLVGSVAEATVRHAPCSVLVAKVPPAPEDEDDEWLALDS